MLVERRLLGILLMRFSRRDRSPCVWRAYVARSFLARSVTDQCQKGAS